MKKAMLPSGRLRAPTSARPPSSRLRAAGWFAVGYCAVAFVLLVTAGRVCADSFSEPIYNKSWYAHNTDLRLVMAFVNGTLLLCAAAALACEIYLSKNDSAGASTTAVAMVHCVGIATATTLCGVIGRTDPPLVFNQAHPKLVASLDVLVMLWLWSYVLHMLRELFGGLVPPGTAAERGHPAVAAWRRLVIETRLGAWTELFCISVSVVMLGVSRLLEDRAAGAAAFAVWVCAFLPPVFSALLLAFDAYHFCGHQPLVRYCGLAFIVVIIPTSVSVVVVEALYQFTDVLPASTGALYADSVLCTSLLPYALAVLTCNTVISSASRMELYQARLLASALHATTQQNSAESREQVLRWLTHETRVPLNSLYMGLQLLHSPAGAFRTLLPPDHEDRDVLSMCISSVEQVLSVLSDVLDMNKMDAGGIKPRVGPAGLSDMLSNVVDQMGMMAQGLGVELQIAAVDSRLEADSAVLLAGTTDLSRQEPALVFDKAHLSQVVANFTSNAIKHSSLGSAVTLSATIVDRMFVPLQPLGSTSARAARVTAPVTGISGSSLAISPARASGWWPFQQSSAAVAPSDHSSATTRRRGGSSSSASSGGERTPVTLSNGQSDSPAEVLSGRTNSGLHLMAAGSAADSASAPHRDSVASEAPSGSTRSSTPIASNDTLRNAVQLQYAYLDVEAGGLTSARITGEDGSAKASPEFPVCRSFGSIDVARLAAHVDPSQVALDVEGRVQVVIVEVIVEDRGCGITAGDAARLFEEFQQITTGADVSRFKGRSTGLGLAISRRIAAALGGIIGVESAPGSGSRFFIRFPAAVGVAGSDLHTQGSAPARPSTLPANSSSAIEAYSASQNRAPGPRSVLPAIRRRPLGGGAALLLQSGGASSVAPLRILVVDDTVMNVKLLVRTLRAAITHAPLIITEATNGQAGLDAIAAGCEGVPFDIVLVDGEMPVLDGYGMVAAMRARGDTTPAIGVTGNVLPSDVQRFISAGAHVVVSKPVRTPDLIGAMRRLLGGARLPGSSLPGEAALITAATAVLEPR